jgi:hypothetical protein
VGNLNSKTTLRVNRDMQNVRRLFEKELLNGLGLDNFGKVSYDVINERRIEIQNSVPFQFRD